jgi:hypothetical protein
VRHYGRSDAILGISKIWVFMKFALSMKEEGIAESMWHEKGKVIV